MILPERVFGNVAVRTAGGQRDEAITEVADDSVNLESVRTLEDMRRWAPRADAWDWDPMPKRAATSSSRGEVH